MNSRPVISSICRACGQRAIKSTSNAHTQKRTISSPIQHLHLPLRLLTTTTYSQVQPINDISISSALPAAEQIPTSIPPSVTPISSQPQPPSPQTQSPKDQEEQPKEKTFIATITSIHNLTAHATYTKQFWDPVFRKHYTKPQHVLVHDPFPSRYNLSNKPPVAPQRSTPSEIGRLHNPTSLLRVGDVVSCRRIPQTDSSTSTSSSTSASQRAEFFSTLELNRKLKTAGKHRKQVIMDHNKAMAKQAKVTRSSRGVKFEVKEVLTPFGEAFEERIASAQGQNMEGSGQSGGETLGEEAEGTKGGGLPGIDGTTIVGGERMAWWKRREMRGDIGKVGKVGKK